MLSVDTLHEEELAFAAHPVLALLARFLPDKTTLALEAWHVDEAAAELTLDVTSTQAWVPCPLCHVLTPRVHSRYSRSLADVPWGAYAVRLQLRVRKFFCTNPTWALVPFNVRSTCVLDLSNLSKKEYLIER